MEWQPIETAPKDCAVLILDNGHIFMAGNDDGVWYWGINVPDRMKISVKLNPTHWMPLPEAPK